MGEDRRVLEEDGGGTRLVTGGAGGGGALDVQGRRARAASLRGGGAAGRGRRRSYTTWFCAAARGANTGAGLRLAHRQAPPVRHPAAAGGSAARAAGTPFGTYHISFIGGQVVFLLREPGQGRPRLL